MREDKKGRVLVVDDNPKNIQVIANLLNDNDYLVEVALGGLEALKWCKNESFDLVILDIMMPEIDGFEACRRIREIPSYDIVSIIFLSAKNDVESVATGLKIGGQDYVSKPFDSIELLARVATHIELKKNREILLKNNDILNETVHKKTQELKVLNQKLVNISFIKNKFIEFIGDNISKPIEDIHKILNRIKSLAESQKLYNSIQQLDIPLERINYLTQLTNEISQLNKDEKIQISKVSLNGLVDHIIINKEKLFENKSIELIVKLSNQIDVLINNKIVFDSISGILEALIDILEYKTGVLITSFQSGNIVELKIEASFNNNKEHNEYLCLFVSYNELVMEHMNGKFEINSNGTEMSELKWIFSV